MQRSVPDAGNGHARCIWTNVGNDAHLRMAVRTVAVTARAAIRSDARLGRPDLAAASARRGLTLLEQLRGELGPANPADIQDQYAAARRGTLSAAGYRAGRRQRAS